MRVKRGERGNKRESWDIFFCLFNVSFASILFYRERERRRRPHRNMMATLANKNVVTKTAPGEWEPETEGLNFSNYLLHMTLPVPSKFEAQQLRIWAPSLLYKASSIQWAGFSECQLCINNSTLVLMHSLSQNHREQQMDAFRKDFSFFSISVSEKQEPVRWSTWLSRGSKPTFRRCIAGLMQLYT